MKMKFTGRLAALAMFALLMVVGAASSLRAQTTATILGSIKDQSGAVLPGADVTVTAVATGQVRTAPTNERGEYRVPGLPVGDYKVEAKLSGFQGEVRSGITLTVGREAVVDFTLQVGNVAESVTITGEAPLIETTTAVVGGVVDQAQMREIPLNGRSFIELAALQTNAVFSEAAESSATKGFGKKLAISGQRYASNSFLLDGADINDAAGGSGSAAGTIAGIETIREFKLVTNAYDAEYGRHTGGVINAVTKSGTNQLHGSAFGFLRNDNLDASKWEDNARGRGEKAEFRRTQFGGSLGGKIVPDKTFFFGSYEALRESAGDTNIYTVPSVALRTAVANGTRAAAATIRPFLEAYPLPNGGAIDADRGNYSSPAPTITNQNYFMGRVDHSINANDSIFFRLVVDNADRDNPAFNTREVGKTGSRYSTLEQTHIYSPLILGRTHFSFVRTNLRFADIPRTDAGFPEFLGKSLGSEADVPGIITITGLQGFGGGTTNPKKHVQNTFQFKEDITWQAGAHSFKFGGQFERFQFNQRSDFYPGGNFTFASVNAFLSGSPTAGNFIRPGSDDIRGWRQNMLGLYVHDDWKVAPGFTLNIGVRYEIISVPGEANGKIATVRNLADSFFYTFNESQTDVGDPMFTNPSLKNFAPRVGFAWTPFGSSKTSVRGGFGIFHDQILPNAYITSGVRMSPFFAVAEVDQASLTAATRTPANPQGVLIDFPNMYFTQQNLLRANIGSKPQLDGFQWAISQPAVYKWSLDIEHELTSSLSISAGYSAARSTHLIRGAVMLNTNPFIPAGVAGPTNFIRLDTAALLNDNFGRMRWRITDATGDYHGMRVSLDKRFSHGFQFNSNFTWAKTTDDTSTWTGSTDFNESDRRGHLNEKEHGLSAFHVPRQWTNTFIVDLPGKNLGGMAGYLLGGWGLNGTIRLNDGFPINPTATVARSNVTTQRFQEGSSLDLIPGGNQNAIRAQNPDAYFDVNQYAYPRFNCANTTDIPGGPCVSSLPAGQFQGNLGRNTMMAPGNATVDMSMKKDANLHMLGDQGKLEFRAEVFNVLNRPNFGSPNLAVFNRTGRGTDITRFPEAGRIDKTRSSSRQIQLSLRVAF